MLKKLPFKQHHADKKTVKNYNVQNYFIQVENYVYQTIHLFLNFDLNNNLWFTSTIHVYDKV